MGLVAAQDPPPTTQSSRGEVVAFSVSKGPETVELPLLTGLNLADAQKKLTEAGLVLGTMSGRTSSRVRSVNQDGVTLPVGSVVAKGSAVNLVFP